MADTLCARTSSTKRSKVWAETQRAVAFNALGLRQDAKACVAREQNVPACLCQCQRERVGKREFRLPASVRLSQRHAVRIQHEHFQTERFERRAVPVFQFPLEQHVRNTEFEGKLEQWFQQATAMQVEQNRCVRDQQRGH